MVLNCELDLNKFSLSISINFRVSDFYNKVNSIKSLFRLCQLIINFHLFSNKNSSVNKFYKLYCFAKFLLKSQSHLTAFFFFYSIKYILPLREDLRFFNWLSRYSIY